MRSIRTSVSSNRAPSTYPYQTESPGEAAAQISDDLINHPTIMKLQQQNFHRLLSSAASSASSSSSIVKSSTSFSSRLNNNVERTTPKIYPNNQSTPVPQDRPIDKLMSDENQRAVLQQRKLALMQAIKNINQQMEELNMQ